MNAYFDGYDEKYPDLIIKILEYFDASNSETRVSDKSVLKFCEKYGIKEKTGGIKYLYQPTMVDRICRKLCENNQMSCIRNIDGLGLQNNYMLFLKGKEFFEENKQRLQYYYNSMVYGFEYIYQMYKNSVVPWRSLMEIMRLELDFNI